MAWTTDDLVSAVKRDIIAPSDEFQFTDQQILDIAWDETMKRLVPAVRAVREDYWTTTIDYTIAVGDTYKRVPARASSSTAASFWLLVVGETAPRRLRAFDSASRQRHVGQQTGQPVGYVLEGDRVYLYPPPDSASYTLRVQYDRRPSRYVPVASCAVINGLDPGTNGILTTGVTRTAGAYTIDVPSAGPPCDLLLADESATWADAAPTYPGQAWYYVSADAIATLQSLGQVEAYVALAGYTCIPPLPDVLHPALVDFTVAALWGKLGYTGKRDLVREDIETYFAGVIQQLAIRVSDDPDFAFNRESPLRTTGYPFFYGGRQ